MPYGRLTRGVRDLDDNSRRRLIVIGVSSFLLLLIVIGAIVGIVVSNKKGSKGNGIENVNGDSGSQVASSTAGSGNTTVINQAVKAVCSVTLHQDSCYRSLSMLEGANMTNDPEQLFRYSLNMTMNRLINISTYPASQFNKTDDPLVREALEICSELIEDSISQLNDSINLMSPQPGETLLTKYNIDELRTWLSATITDQETCIDGFAGTSGGYMEDMQATLTNSTELASNSLAIASKIMGVLGQFNSTPHRKLLMDVN